MLHFKYNSYKHFGAIRNVKIKDESGKVIGKIGNGQILSVDSNASKLSVRLDLYSGKVNIEPNGRDKYFIIFFKLRKEPLYRTIDLYFTNYLTIQEVTEEEFRHFSHDFYETSVAQLIPTDYGLITLNLIGSMALMGTGFWFYESNSWQQNYTFLYGLIGLVSSIINYTQSRVFPDSFRWKMISSGGIGLILSLFLPEVPFYIRICLIAFYAVICFRAFAHKRFATLGISN